MEDDNSNDSTTVDTAKADRSVWLMKCPPIVSKAWQSSASSVVADSPPVDKVVVSLDPLRAEDPSSLKVKLHSFMRFTMEMAGRRVAMEGKVEHKFDMKPHHANIEEYRKMCRERTNKSMVKNRQIQVINNDRGVHMRPMPGMMGLITSTSKDKKKAAPVKGPDVKRTRRDRGELEDIMFKLFERQPNWALKQLVQETDQPAVCLCLSFYFVKLRRTCAFVPSIC
ncbi:hypothetical protein DH2020_035013 [Rehmannia glutinosa]|uniref:TFIIF beta subunit HTH domain-containing protein n=1 Tax=Rehmannia glutinosa TaxID=99300 RepID=A0ABR0V8E0_REHGL